MNALRAGIFFAAVLFGLLASGCSTPDTVDKRIKAKSELYAGLTGQEQQQIHDGVIAIGFSPDMVFMALGKPEQVIPGSGPGAEDWLYHNTYSKDGHYGPMGRTMKMSLGTEMVSSGDGGGAAVPHAIDYSKPGARKINPTYQVEYDSQYENITPDTTIKVRVKFTEGTVADIEIINDGHGD